MTVIISNLDVNCVYVKSRKKLLKMKQKFRMLGDVDPWYVNQHHSLWINDYVNPLRAHGLAMGLELSGQWYGRVLPLHGSIIWHRDPGTEWVLNWLVNISYIDGYITDINTPCLLAQGDTELTQLLSLKVGDVFAFNASKGHAWISNESTLLVQLPIKKRPIC